MAKAKTKSQIITEVAERADITKKQAVETLEALAEVAYKEAKNGCVIPGLGKLVLVARKARMGFNLRRTIAAPLAEFVTNSCVCADMRKSFHVLKP